MLRVHTNATAHNSGDTTREYNNTVESGLTLGAAGERLIDTEPWPIVSKFDNRNPYDSNPNTMHIPQDIVDLIVDQLSLRADNQWEWDPKAASLVSTAWVNRSQYHLFSTLEFYGKRELLELCSRIKPDPCGILRHVRVLTLGDKDNRTVCRPVTASDIETSLPHLTSLTNLWELIIGCPNIAHTSLGVLTPIFSSSPGILKLHWWTSWHTDVHETLKNISRLADLLPNLTHVTISGDQNRYDEVQLLADEESPSGIKCFNFHKLRIYYVTSLFLPFFESCGSNS